MVNARSIRRFARTHLRLFGYVITKSNRIPSFERFVLLVKKYGLSPKSVFDIGVAYGTEWLYTAFPGAHFYLIDPTNESLPYMQEWSTKLDASIFSFALGEREEVATINVRPDIGGSSFFPEVGKADLIARYQVPVKRFETSFNSFGRPALCKIDVQGAELSVLRGMGSRIREFDIFVVELSLVATLKGDAAEFAAVTAYMKEYGFVLYDIIAMTRRPLDNALAQIDAVFVQEASPLRRDRRWS